MRKHYKQILKEFFCKKILQCRTENSFTQGEMARCLALSRRAYYSLDTGKSCCGAVTLALFMIYCCPDPVAFLEELRVVIENDFSKNERSSIVVWYRKMLSVEKVLVYDNGDCYPICPRCDCTMEYEYASYCDRCGQKLDWNTFDDAQIVYAPRFCRNQKF